MKKFNLLVEIQVVEEQACELTVEAETLDEAKKIAEQMFNDGSLSFNTVDSSVTDFYAFEA